jgi:hypothetical protein
MDKLVSTYYAQKGSLKPIEEKGNVKLNMQALPKTPGFCKSRYRSFFMIPLLVYTMSNEKINCRVNPKIYVNVFAGELYSALQAEVYKIDGKTLEINFTDVPSSFTHRYQEHLVALPYVWTGFEKEEAHSDNAYVRLNYTVRDASLNIVKQGEIEQIVNPTAAIRSWSLRRKTFIQNFVANFDSNLESSCREAARAIVNQL